MSFSQKQLSLTFNLIPLLLGLIKFVELMHAGAPGPDKRAAVLSLGQQALAVGVGAVVANNPAYAQIAGPVVDSIVGSLNSSGQMPTPVAPTPPTND